PRIARAVELGSHLRQPRMARAVARGFPLGGHERQGWGVRGETLETWGEGEGCPWFPPAGGLAVCLPGCAGVVEEDHSVGSPWGGRVVFLHGASCCSRIWAGRRPDRAPPGAHKPRTAVPWHCAIDVRRLFQEA